MAPWTKTAPKVPDLPPGLGNFRFLYFSELMKLPVCAGKIGDRIGRLGDLVFALKEAVGVEAIRAREESFIRRAIQRWSADPAIEILGNPGLDRLSIVSFVVRHEGRYLHHNFVVALLNDLFGIQSRGGCSCAGPYGLRLLGIDVLLELGMTPQESDVGKFAGQHQRQKDVGTAAYQCKSRAA